MGRKILDEFTDLPVSHTRKWQLRNPEKAKALKQRYKERPETKAKQREYYQRWYLARKGTNYGSGHL
jgi:hypothetical protein